MIKLFQTYFQKSKVFLYPLLGIGKGSRYVPKETYMSWKDLYNINDMKLCCVYKEKCTESYIKFERNKLLKNKDFLDYKKLEKETHLYIFDMRMYPQTWLAITEGMYSKVNEREKQKILNFFGDKGVIGQTVESYLYPDYYHEDYAELLNVDLEFLQKVWEVCDKPNLKKETLLKKGRDITIIQNKSISLPDKL